MFIGSESFDVTSGKFADDTMLIDVSHFHAYHISHIQLGQRTFEA